MFGTKNVESFANCRTLEISMDCTNHPCVVIPLVLVLWVGFFFDTVFASGDNLISVGDVDYLMKLKVCFIYSVLHLSFYSARESGLL